MEKLKKYNRINRIRKKTKKKGQTKGVEVKNKKK